MSVTLTCSRSSRSFPRPSASARANLDLPLLGPGRIDADRMLQAFKNIVENAIEFSSAGGTVVFDARAERHTAQTLVLSVVVQGPGFRDEDLPHVFEPFFTRRRGGSGLGLAIVQKIGLRAVTGG